MEAGISLPTVCRSPILRSIVLIRHLRSGVLDHVPSDLPDRIAPGLVEHYERVKNEPGVRAYCASANDFNYLLRLRAPTNVRKPPKLTPR